MQFGRCSFGTALLCVLCASSLTYAQNATEPSSDDNDEKANEEVIVVDGEAPYIPVASKSVRSRDLLMRPRPRPADILRVVPGMFVNQHAGGGKANQYFLRGFDADHGTDIALSFDGVPINMVSHGHGQGYADLSWVIPELVDYVDVFKGPYAPSHGDFATAGSIQMVSRSATKRTSVATTVGRFETFRLLATGSPWLTRRWRSLVAAESYFTNGPFSRGEGYARYNAFAKLTRDLGAGSSLALSLTSYAGSWNASGQIPQRAVDAGALGRFDSIDPTDGGDSSRHSAYLTYLGRPTGDSELSILAYAVRYQFAMFSNFTFFANDPVMGDQIEQTDSRTMLGLRTRYRTRTSWRSIRFDTSIGAEARRDDIDNALYKTSARSRWDTTADARVVQASAAAWLKQDIAWTRRVRTVLGARYDYYDFNVRDRLAMVPGSSSASRGILSPKASLVVTPRRRLDLFANFGMGFHSNDARSNVRRTGTELARATGYELGTRAKVGDWLDLAGSLWLLDLDSEIVWVGDEGATEARGPTRRYGVELETRARLTDWLIADADVTLSRARFRDLPSGNDQIPLAPRLTVTAGVSVRHPKGMFGRLGLRSLSDRPLTEDGFLQADGFTLVDLTVGYRTGRYEISLAADNLLNAAWREAQFATTSRLGADPAIDMPPPPNTCPAGTRTETSDNGSFAGCNDVHFTPGAPLNVMATLRLFY